LNGWLIQYNNNTIVNWPFLKSSTGSISKTVSPGAGGFVPVPFLWLAPRVETGHGTTSSGLRLVSA